MTHSFLMLNCTPCASKLNPHPILIPYSSLGQPATKFAQTLAFASHFLLIPRHGYQQGRLVCPLFTHKHTYGDYTTISTFTAVIQPMFSKLFGGGTSKPKPDPPKPATQAPPPPPSSKGNVGPAAEIEQLDNAIEILEKKISLNERKASVELEKAKEYNSKGNKAFALQCMKRKKQLEEQITSSYAQMSNLETMRTKLQESAMLKQVMQATRAGANRLEQDNKEMNAEQIEDEREKIQDIMDQQKAVAEALSQPLDGEYVDEDELLGELDDLMELEAEEAAAAKVPAAKTKTQQAAAVLPDMPSVPKTKLPVKPVEVEEEGEDEAALRALEAELNS